MSSLGQRRAMIQGSMVVLFEIRVETTLSVQPLLASGASKPPPRRVTNDARDRPPAHSLFRPLGATIDCIRWLQTTRGVMSMVCWNRNGIQMIRKNIEVLHSNNSGSNAEPSSCRMGWDAFRADRDVWCCAKQSRRDKPWLACGDTTTFGFEHGGDACAALLGCVIRGTPNASASNGSRTKAFREQGAKPRKSKQRCDFQDRCFALSPCCATRGGGSVHGSDGGESRELYLPHSMPPRPVFTNVGRASFIHICLCVDMRQSTTCVVLSARSQCAMLPSSDVLSSPPSCL